jgi:hypothetical protein
MKKLLLLSLLTITFLQAEEDATMQSQNVCYGGAIPIYKDGLKECKENDILYASIKYSSDKFLAICKEGTVQPIKEGFATCTLRAEKDFGKIIEH